MYCRYTVPFPKTSQKYFSQSLHNTGISFQNIYINHSLQPAAATTLAKYLRRIHTFFYVKYFLELQHFSVGIILQLPVPSVSQASIKSYSHKEGSRRRPQLVSAVLCSAQVTLAYGGYSKQNTDQNRLSLAQPFGSYATTDR